MKTFDLTIIITSFHSSDKIFNCIESIEKSIKIIVVENSNDEKLKEEIHSKYQNVECILSKENLCKNGSGKWDRTTDLGLMSPAL